MAARLGLMGLGRGPAQESPPPLERVRVDVRDAGGAEVKMRDGGGADERRTAKAVGR